MAKVTCHGAGLVSADADLKNSFTVFVEKGKISGISVAFEGKLSAGAGQLHRYGQATD